MLRIASLAIPCLVGSILLGGCPMPPGSQPTLTSQDLDGPWTWLADKPGSGHVCYIFANGSLIFVSLFCDSVNYLAAPAPFHLHGNEFSIAFAWTPAYPTLPQASATFQGTVIDGNTIEGVLTVSLAGSDFSSWVPGTFTRD